ncbi:hypothetical protein RIF29_13673 [Crotalaria pallida]|uniref:Peptidase A1 domain-containing protein n=1 Tax=Crotalaria pallida TaxID=3830 RepID=A0AAN9P3H4_CROPI
MYYSSLVLVLLFLCLGGISLIEARGFSVELIHRDSPKSPFYLQTETHFQRVSNAIHRSIRRTKNNNNVAANVIIDPGEYLMEYSIGTPPFKVLGILDTGSDIIWLQCKPCNPCYNQTTPIFDPSKSSTYKTIPCTSQKCKSVTDTSCSSDDDKQRCEYITKYVDGSASKGDLSADTLTLGSTKGSPLRFPKTVVGCGHSNTLKFQGQGSGIVGIGNGPISLINQLGPSVQGKFSYCLVSISSNITSSKLNFGDDAVVAGKGTVSTPMFLSDVFYLVILEGFLVGNKRFVKFRSYFDAEGKGNIVVDSGTTLTVLPYDVYDELESAVADVMKNSKRVDDPNQVLNLCYKYSEKMEVPVITARFKGGAEVQLKPLNTFVQVSDDVSCFAFRGLRRDQNDQLAIFGNVAQQNYLVGYDLQNKLISFKPKDCAQQGKTERGSAFSLSQSSSLLFSVFPFV